MEDDLSSKIIEPVIEPFKDCYDDPEFGKENEK